MKVPFVYGILLGLISGSAKLFSYSPTYSPDIQELLGYIPIASLFIGTGACMAHIRFNLQKGAPFTYKESVRGGVIVAITASAVIGTIAYTSKSFDTYTAFTGNLVIGMGFSFLLGLLFKK